MPRVGLHMIVKDEARVIERCLTSVLPLIDWWVISDTGSTDGTQDVIRRVLAERPGRLLERPWVDFGHNRQEALDAARAFGETGDYALWIDADDELAELPDRWPALTADGYLLPVAYGPVRFRRVAVVRLDAPWQWVGPVHEVLTLPGAAVESLSSPRVVQHHEGARSRDPETYRRDAELLAAELRRRPGDPRTQFYLAQSWRDAGDLERASALYRDRRSNPDGWEEERWYAGFQLARCRELLGDPIDRVIDTYLGAWAERSLRAEPLVEAARLERHRERPSVAMLYAREATRTPLPVADALFVEPDSYGWRAWDELAVACYWAGHAEEGRAAAVRALELRPGDPRLRENLAWFGG